MFNSPCVSSASFNPADAKMLNEETASEFHSLVGVAMYLSQRRNDVQFCVKTLAADLKSPSWASWGRLRRLVGYLRFSQDCAVSMEQSSKGATFLKRQFESSDDARENKRNCDEVFTDWGPWLVRWRGFQVYIVSCAHAEWSCHIRNMSNPEGSLTFSSSEAEWYSASSWVCDSVTAHCWFHHGRRCGWSDSSRGQLSSQDVVSEPCSGRLRRIHGRYLWLQSKVASGVLAINRWRHCSMLLTWTKRISQRTFHGTFAHAWFCCKEWTCRGRWTCQVAVQGTCEATDQGHKQLPAGWCIAAYRTAWDKQGCKEHITYRFSIQSSAVGWSCKHYNTLDCGWTFLFVVPPVYSECFWSRCLSVPVEWTRIFWGALSPMMGPMIELGCAIALTIRSFVGAMANTSEASGSEPELEFKAWQKIVVKVQCAMRPNCMDASVHV